MLTTNDVDRLIANNVDVVSNDGDKLGTVGQAYVDDTTGEPTWITVKTGLFGNKENFVPAEQVTVTGDEVRVPYDKDTLKGAPSVDADGHISAEEEDELYRYYGLQTPTGWDGPDYAGTGGTTGTGTTGTGTTGTGTTGMTGTTGTATTDTADTLGRDDEASVVRAEEQVDVGTRRREAGRVRLRKYVVTENVTKTVPVQREEVRVEREPITDAGVGTGRIGEEDDTAEVTLHEDEVVVDKTTQPVERVSLDKDTVTDQEQVTEQVRKEQVETETDRGRGDLR